jgi:DNA-binding response OmpR family regulator
MADQSTAGHDTALPESPALQTVLIVDDDEAVRTILTQALHMRGFKVLTAVDGVEALKAVEDHSLDLIILDLLMPNRDGLTVLRDLREMPSAPPIIFMTGNASPQVQEEALALGADRFLLKPFELRQLLDVLDAVLSVRQNRLAPFRTTVRPT